ncbi:MAG: prefoldin subunit alpha [Nitrososphaerales archaeon]|nr:prefoldin subunit alpha [Nitrososphaerales archaeon]
MSNGASDEDKVNNLVVEIRVLESTYNELSSRQNLLERALLENRSALDAIKGLSGKGKGEVLTQIGGGAMVRSPAPSVDKVLVNIGASVVIEKTREEALAVLETRAKDVEHSIVSILGQRNEIAERLQADQQLLQTIVSRANQKG